MPKRPGTQGDHGRFARRESPASGVPVVAEDEVTGRYEGDELKAARARRPTPLRLERLEEDRDEFARSMADLRVDVAEIKGTLKVLPALVESVKESADRLAAREDQTLRNRLEIDKAEELARIDLAADARKTRRKFYLTVACTFVSGGGVTWLLHYLGAF